MRLVEMCFALQDDQLNAGISTGLASRAVTRPFRTSSMLEAPALTASRPLLQGFPGPRGREDLQQSSDRRSLTVPHAMCGY
jgi:hypothetical protein